MRILTFTNYPVSGLEVRLLVGFLIGTRSILSSSLYATDYSVIWIFTLNPFYCLYCLRLETRSKALTLPYPKCFRSTWRVRLTIATMKPCPHGWHLDPKKSCTCSASVVARYQKRISGRCLNGSSSPLHESVFSCSPHVINKWWLILAACHLTRED